jgi:MerR family transcriptional regulator, redox-sensitive transcriptional activator SoxR
MLASCTRLKDLPQVHYPNMRNDSDPLINIRDMAQRSGVVSATLRYYERLGLIASEREGSSEHRRYRESTFNKICYITIGQRAGFSLEEIAAQLATLPDHFPVPKKDWEPMSRIWDERIDQRIAELKQLKIDIVNCTCGRTKSSARGR